MAFSVPDIAAQATIKLISLDSGEDVACVSSGVSNGKTVDTKLISYVAGGIAGAALIFAGLSAVGAGGQGSAPGSGTPSPSFTEVFTWFQGIAINGMMSVNYPTIYRSFTKNFAFATGIIPWTSLQEQLDTFRSKTGGNLTNNNVQFFKNATFAFTDGPSSSNGTGLTRRDLSAMFDSILSGRDLITSTGPEGSNSTTLSEARVVVYGMQAYVEQLRMPSSNTFLTLLLIIAIVIASIVVGILLFKLILELWALCASFPKSLVGFRKHYWGTMARSIVTLILLFYGVWVMFCIFQFKNGGSWAATLLAAVTLAVFTAILAFFTFRIWLLARRYKKTDGTVSRLYEDKATWLKYSLFYDTYKKTFWWLFIPWIIYGLAKSIVLVVADGHGLAQTIGQLVIEIIMLGLLIWNRPYERRSGNIVNIVIQVVRALTVACIIVFVQELGIPQTTQTVMGLVLIIVQSSLTAILAILIAVNAIIVCCKTNPHRKRRKEAERLKREMERGSHEVKDPLLIEEMAGMPNSKTSYVSETQMLYPHPVESGHEVAYDPYGPRNSSRISGHVRTDSYGRPY